MKRLLTAVVIACLMMTFSLPALGAETDLSVYSNEELMEVLRQVQAELVSRRIQKSAILQAGQYVGGREVPVGSYILSHEAGQKPGGIVWLRSANDQPNKLYEYVDDKDAFSTYVFIEEGDILDLPCTYTLTVYAGLVFE